MDSQNLEDNKNRETLQRLKRSYLIDVDMIEKHLYLSAKSAAESMGFLFELDVKYILSVFAHNLYKKSDLISYMSINAYDYELQDLLTHFPETNQFIGSAIDSGHNVLVHCQVGKSRSATVVLAYLMNKRRISVDSALDLVNRFRLIFPNEGFIAQLRIYEEMGFTLNANHKKLRYHLINTLLNNNDIWGSRQRNTIKDYFERRDLVEGMQLNLDLGQKCLCLKCGQHLFNKIHILQMSVNIEETTLGNVCKWTYIEPQKWMKQLEQPFEHMLDFEIRCPQCGEEVLEFKKEFKKYKCKCCLHSGLRRCRRFRIKTEKFRIEDKV